MNPRDTKMALLADVNIHRIIRRGTTYGAPGARTSATWPLVPVVAAGR